MTRKAESEARSQSKWDEMLEEFRALGGVADNFVQREGAVGRGLFPIEPGRPVQISCPENLLIGLADIIFENGKLRIRKDAKFSDRERAFLEAYEEEFSWGAGGRESAEAYFERLDALPESVREVLVNNLGLTGAGDANKGPGRVRRRFLRSRVINYGDDQMIMPIVELANHGSRGCPFNTNGGVSISGRFDNEVFAHYGMVDPLGAFEAWGFSNDETVAYSLRAVMKIAPRRLVIARELSSKKVRGKFRVPVLEADDEKITLSHLMLGHARFPRVSKGIFYQFMEEAGEPNAEELFDQIRRLNIQQFLKLMEVLEGHQGELISSLRTLCRHQISAITNSIGTREI